LRARRKKEKSLTHKPYLSNIEWLFNIGWGLENHKRASLKKVWQPLNTDTKLCLQPLSGLVKAYSFHTFPFFWLHVKICWTLSRRVAV
jgi:hypothetical protein